MQQAVAALPPRPPVSTLGGDDGSGATQMAPYLVTEEKDHEFKERHLLTKKGVEEMMRKKYPGLGGPLLANGYIKKEIREDDLRKERNLEMKGLFGLMEIDGKVSPEMKRESERALMRYNEKTQQKGTPFREPMPGSVP